MSKQWSRALSFMLPPLVDGILLGSIVGGVNLYIAVQHNPQGEFYDYDSHAVILLAAIPLFLSWFLPVALLVFVVQSLTALFWRWLGLPR
ncbi:hypothetical protein ACTDI4_08980 [Mesorhizobium sp. PUT5]|uniref:hypothetical protein n=1 Tax=Mesorhizobium sp. PUT5 TaxID=3454629 RepID=UPI003FA41E40